MKAFISRDENKPILGLQGRHKAADSVKYEMFGAGRPRDTRLTNLRWRDKAEKPLLLGAQRPSFTRNRHGQFILPVPSMDFLLTSRLIIVNQLQETSDS
jgi:hypothetical protein